ncbi:MAG: hypothetical protein WCS11_08570 [Dysgonamonadaceae bacterium]|nr:hypothetical protein [Dysgonamonadaceae bacterium]MDD3356591.1 hypothetical protein [Dysgonamonadaceae bacterium]MDD3728548.1 hypothetical protein [Dysgonamonadaceae bacterium]
MAKLIKNLQNNRKVIFDKGKFDEWCVYVVESNGLKKAPFDETYFSELQQISLKYPNNKLYDDFVLLYEETTKHIDSTVLTLIDDIVSSYNEEDRIAIEQWFTVIYAGMIAEENKENAILRKRIKRLGMHQVLLLNMSAKDAAQFSYGKKWRVLDAIMKPLGF